MSIIASLDGCDHGSQICFEIDWETGVISEPFIRFSHERNSSPMHVFHGRAAIFATGTDVLATSDWDQLKKVLTPLVEAARAEFSTELDNNFNERGSFTEKGQEVVWQIENAVDEFEFDAEYGVFHPADLFSCDYFDDDNDPCSSTMAIRAVIEGGDGIQVTAFTGDDDLTSFAQRLQDTVDEHVVLTQTAFDWLDDLRQMFREADGQWGDLRQPLESLIDAGDPRVRYKSQHPKYNPEGEKPILMATCRQPGPGQFEPAILDATGDALRQWWRAGLDFPEECLAAAERSLLATVNRESASLLQDSLSQSDSERSASELEQEINRLESHLARLKVKLDTLSPNRMTARAAALFRALARWENGLFAVNGPELSLEIRREGALKAMRAMLTQGLTLLPVPMEQRVADWLVERDEERLLDLTRDICDQCAATPDNPVADQVKVAGKRVLSLWEDVAAT
jgi:hypothetical protein